MLTHATILNRTLKPSPATSNTEALARVLLAALESRGATCELVRPVDLNLLPGPTYLETDEGHEWSAKTARTAAANLVTVAEALAAHPLPTPSS